MHSNCHMPCAIPAVDGAIKATYKAPTVPNSDLPALLGLQSIKNSRGIIDTNENKLYLVGPGAYNLIEHLPPGTKVVQCEQAPSGHLMMPVDGFEDLDKSESQGGLETEAVALPVSAKKIPKKPAT